MAGLVVIASMAIIALVIPYAVFSRYILENTPTWSDELALFCLVWASMLGAAITLHKGYQVGITFFVKKSPPGISRILQIAGFVLMLAFLSLAIIFGLRQTLFNMRQLSAAMGIPMAIPYASLPMGFFLMLLITIEEFIGFVQRKGKKVD